MSLGRVRSLFGNDTVKNSKSRKTFLIAAGGTGGHIVPGIAIAEELRMRGHRCVFVGTERGFESRLVPEVGFEIELVNVGPWNGVSAARRIKTIIQLFPGLPAAAVVLERIAPSAVLSLGGYTAAAIVLSALVASVPVVVMEPNAKPGLVNRLTGPFAAWSLTGFEGARKWFPAARCEMSGIPVRPEFFNISPRTARSPFTVFVTGGSLGARRLNQAVVEATAAWQSSGCWKRMRLVHQTGKGDYEKTYRAFEKSALSVELTPFVKDMPRAFAEADVIVCRAGASTVAELSAAAKPSVLIPYSFATDQHQLANAQAMVDVGASRLILDQELNGERLASEVESLMNYPEQLTAMEAAARGQSCPGSVENVANRLEQTVGLR